MAAAMTIPGSAPVWADGMVMGPARYKGSLAERAQEAIIIFNSAPPQREATEDLILKIRVEGEAAQFAWVVPFPSQPIVNKAGEKLFKELYDYVAYRTRPAKNAEKKGMGGSGGMSMGGETPVDVLSRKVVGAYDVAVVRENQPGALNKWLDDEGYQRIVDGDDVIEFYRKKGYVFSCIKVTEANLKANKPVDLHPLRFTFKTGGRDGIYFPMKMSSLQKQPFNVNLYVFYQWWLNDKLNQYGYEHRGFHRLYRDWDSPQCKPDAGKDWARPTSDPFLHDAALQLQSVARLFHKLHPHDRYYLTNIQAWALKPEDVRKWPDDLWLFPYYRDKKRVPFDAQPGGLAAAAYAQ
jgi:hypothetical protein